ncbi:MAG: hypothetical protein DRZ82_00780, partial [Thermoprotei archaeon]
LHVHSFFSRDSNITPNDLLNAKIRKGLDFIAITDHDEFRGALKISRLLEDKVKILPGIELSAREGHIIVIGLDSEKDGRRYLKLINSSVWDILDEVLDNNHVMIIAHPLDIIRGGIGLSLLYKILKRNSPMVCVETINSASCLSPLYSRLRRTLSQRFPYVKQVGGSDAHIADEIGLAMTLVRSSGCSSLIECLLEGSTIPYGRYTNLGLRVKDVSAKIKLKLTRLSS